MGYRGASRQTQVMDMDQAGCYLRHALSCDHQWDPRALIKVHPEIGVKMMAELGRRLRDTDATLSD